MKATKISKQGIDLIKKFEGFSSKPYRCPAGIPTIGYGATYYPDGQRKVSMDDRPISEQEAEIILSDMLRAYERCVDSYCTDKISQNQFDALVSFAYNVGCGNLKKSRLLKFVNFDCDNPNIKKEFMKWCKSYSGSIIKGLLIRRKEEAELYFKKQ